MKHLLQPNRFTCTQTSVAMATGRDLPEVFELLGHQSSSNMREAGIALAKLGYTEERFLSHVDNRKHLDLSGTGILRVAPRNARNGHMVAFKDGVIHDPEGRRYEGAKALREDFKAALGKRWIVTQVLYITKNEEEL